MKYLISVIAAFAMVGAALAQNNPPQDNNSNSTGAKMQKGISKQARKASTWVNKTSKGFNHAMQRTDKRYSKAEVRKQNKNTQISGGHSGHMSMHHGKRHYRRGRHMGRRHAGSKTDYGIRRHGAAGRKTRRHGMHSTHMSHRKKTDNDMGNTTSTTGG